MNHPAPVLWCRDVGFGAENLISDLGFKMLDLGLMGAVCCFLDVARSAVALSPGPFFPDSAGPLLLCSSDLPGFRVYGSGTLIPNLLSHSLHYLFLDGKQAFDSLAHTAMLTALDRFGIPPNYLFIIASLYTDPLFKSSLKKVW